MPPGGPSSCYGFGRTVGLADLVASLDDADRPRIRALERALVVTILAWVFWRTQTLCNLAWPFTADDAYITLRYSRHLAAGHGPLWNLGEAPVEGYSNFTYLVFGAGAIKLGLDPVYVLKGVGLVSLHAALGLSFVIARHFTRALPSTLAPIFLTAKVGVIWWAASGLETTTYMALALATGVAVVRGLGYRFVEDDWDRPETRRYSGRWLGVAGLLAAVTGLTRPEGPLLFAAGAMALIFDVLGRIRAEEPDARRRGLRAFVNLAVPFAVLWGGYFVARGLYFGRLFPNTIYCKGEYDGSPFVQHFEYWESSSTLLVLALFVPLRRLDARWALLWGVPVGYALMLVGVDPIVTHFERHFLYAHAFVCVGVAINLGCLLDYLFTRRFVRLRGLVVVVLVLAFQSRLARDVGRPIMSINEDYRARMSNRAALGDWLDARMPAHEAFLIGDAGMVPFKAHSRVIDAFCLNSPVMTSPAIERDTEAWVDWVIRQLPLRMVVHSSSPSRLKPRPEYDFYPALVDDPRFEVAYEQEKVFPDSRYSYFVFVRREDAAERLAELSARELERTREALSKLGEAAAEGSEEEGKTPAQRRREDARAEPRGADGAPVAPTLAAPKGAPVPALEVKVGDAKSKPAPTKPAPTKPAPTKPAPTKPAEKDPGSKSGGGFVPGPQ